MLNLLLRYTLARPRAKLFSAKPPEIYANVPPVGTDTEKKRIVREKKKKDN